jgi:hypothetical protein
MAELTYVRRAAAAALVVGVSCIGCGGRSNTLPAAATSTTDPSWSAGTCRRQTQVIADDAHQILLHYGPQSAYPADLGFFMFRGALLEFQRHGCAPQLLGSTLDRRLTKKQLTELLSHLPATIVLYLRRSAGPT